MRVELGRETRDFILLVLCLVCFVAAFVGFIC